MKKSYTIACTILAFLIVLFSGVLIAFLQKTFTVTFDTKGGTIYKAVEVKPNTKVMQPNPPVMQGYVFRGWYIGDSNDVFDFDTKITNDITITAKWESIF